MLLACGWQWSPHVAAPPVAIVVFAHAMSIHSDVISTQNGKITNEKLQLPVVFLVFIFVARSQDHHFHILYYVHMWCSASRIHDIVLLHRKWLHSISEVISTRRNYANVAFAACDVTVVCQSSVSPQYTPLACLI